MKKKMIKQDIIFIKKDVTGIEYDIVKNSINIIQSQ